MNDVVVINNLLKWVDIRNDEQKKLRNKENFLNFIQKFSLHRRAGEAMSGKTWMSWHLFTIISSFMMIFFITISFHRFMVKNDYWNRSKSKLLLSASMTVSSYYATKYSPINFIIIPFINKHFSYSCFVYLFISTQHY